MGFVLQHELGVSRQPSREFVGGAERLGEGEDGDGVGAADRRRERGERPAQNIVPRVAPRHHPPRCLGEDQRRLGREAAGLFNARPKATRGAEFRHAQQFVGVGAESERDQSARCVEVDSGVRQRA